MRRNSAKRSPSPLPLCARESAELEGNLEPLQRGLSNVAYSPQKKMRAIKPPVRRRAQRGRRVAKGTHQLPAHELGHGSPQRLTEGPPRQENAATKDPIDESLLPVNDIGVISSPERSSSTADNGFGAPGRYVPPPTTNYDPEDFAYYTEAVLLGCVGFIHLHGMMFAVEGWSSQKGEGTDRWYHFDASVHGSSSVMEITDMGGILAIHHFSIAKLNDELGMAHRAMVSYEASIGGDGVWKCAKDGSACIHISVARKSMRGVFLDDDDSENDEKVEVDDSSVNIDISNQREYNSHRAISYLPILPPHWAMLPQEQTNYC
ncbi:hypothetical protein GYMLUDRAFT_249751 [Collybiopsis luxurians FD-317 M1]|uniref:Uncharacterized protein n=1 Tax=Collybiopsis luxurians FD-317 M1 TaxID=944289 RepID=A0A0D0C886_9AGAR|nr:hypothetical protein GYMLUDRAFT_249751 [Collybiopsis luxurians FD-317 M1]